MGGHREGGAEEVGSVGSDVDDSSGSLEGEMYDQVSNDGLPKDNGTAGLKPVQCIVPGLQEDSRRSEDVLEYTNGHGGHREHSLPWSQEAYARIIVQALQKMGYHRSAQALEEEAGVNVQNAAVRQLHDAVMSGDWSRAEGLVTSFQLRDSEMGKCRFIIKRQKYLELLEQDSVPAAMQCLQTELTPLGEEPTVISNPKPQTPDHEPQTQPPGKPYSLLAELLNLKWQVIHALAALVACPNSQALRLRAGWDGAGAQGRKEVLTELNGFLPPSVMLPQNRLDTLVSQALQHQMDLCLRYNRVEPWTDLLQDCHATEERVPQVTLANLDKHTDEVWYVQFSNNGKLLASASKDKTIIIWNVTFETKEPEPVYILSGHSDSVSFVSWSHDDQKLLSCGNDQTIRLWDIATGTLLRIYHGHQEPATALAWMPCGTRFVSGGYDKKIFTWKTDSEEPEAQYSGERISDLVVSKDGSRMVTISTDRKIRIFQLPSMQETACTTEKESLTSISLSYDSRYLLINVCSESNPEVHLWDLEEKTIIRKFTGHKQGRYVIRSCFGGVREVFVACGSEDSQVYLWHKGTGALLKTLHGHAGTINCVAWSPLDPTVFASASDDNTVRVWGCPKSDM